jgi:DNA-binding CsgD family transcriptional regulator
MPRPRAQDLLAVLEATYAGAVDEDTWLRGVLTAAGPWLDRGLGAMAHRFVHRDETLWLGGQIGVGAAIDAGEAIARAWRERMDALWADPENRVMVQRFYPAAPVVSSFRELAQLDDDGMEELASSVGLSPTHHFGDAFGVVAGNPSGEGCVLYSISGTALRGASARWTRAERALWLRIATHIATGYRLVRKEATVDAVLDPNGKVQHLEAGAVASRETLVDAARAVERARGALRRTDPERAVAIWKGLVEGQWTLVDHFDHDGRRFVVARRNPPDARAWHTLTDSEMSVLYYAAHGHPYKLIAYELGIAVATVTNRLASAARKVGAASRFELVTAYRAATTPGPKTGARTAR